MLRRLIVFAVWALAALGAAEPASALSLAVKQALGSPGWVLPYNPDLQFDFARGAAWKGTGTGGGAVVPLESVIASGRASAATDLLPSSPAEFPYRTFVANQLVRTPNVGVLPFEARTNQLLNSTAPVTQTTGSLANGTYTLWVNGSGSATMSAGTATGCGTGVATTGTPVNFTTTGAAGTCTVTVADALNAFQLELGIFGTSLIVTAGVTATRTADSNIAALPLVITPPVTLWADATPGLTQALNQYVAELSIDSSNRISIWRSAAPNLPSVLLRTNAISSPNRAIVGAAVWAARKKVVFSTINGGFSAVFDGGALDTGSVTTVVNTGYVMNVGHSSGNVQHFNAPVQGLAVWQRRSPPAGDMTR